MIRRAIPGLVVAVAGIAGIVAIGRNDVVAPDAYFATPAGELSLAERRCESCHSFKNHVSHPMGDGFVDPRDGKRLGCAACHFPHGSEWEYFLQGDPNGKLCVTCHTDKIRAR